MDIMGQAIFLRPGSGLCNRLRVINSALNIAKQWNCRLVVDWFRCPIKRWAPRCGISVRFTDLFEPISGVHFIDRLMIRNDFPWNVKRYSGRNPYFYSEKSEKEFIADVRSGRNQKLWFWTCKAFYPYDDYAWLKPRREIQESIDCYKEKLGPQSIGLHIRRTDNRAAIEKSPLSLFTEKIEEEFNLDASTRFFLSTDAPELKGQLRERYGSRILFLDDVGERYTHKGERDAVKDLFLLACTRKIYGSFFSSFSEEAAKIGHIPLQVLSR